jgi:hypothetical protein
MKAYKRACGLITHRGSGGKFRKSTLKDIGVYDGNDEGHVYICNVCGAEFVPIVHSGQYCGVDDKRIKEKVYTPEQSEILYKIKAIESKPFINRKDLSDINELKVELSRLPKV